MTFLNPEALFDEVLNWYATERARRRRERRIAAGIASLLALTGAALQLPTSRDGTGAVIGMILLVCGILGLLVPVLRDAWRVGRRERLRGPFFSPTEAGVPLPGLENPRIERFVAVLASCDTDDWKRLVSAARRSGALDRSPVDAAIAAVVRGRPDGTDALSERFASAADIVSRAVAILGRCVSKEVVPFTPPFAEYRIAFAGVLGLLATEYDPRAPEGPLETFAFEAASASDA
jgi:hypothetical protein